MTTFGLSILDGLQQLHTPWLDGLMIFFTTIGDNGLVWIGIGGALLISKRYRRLGLTVAVALLLSLLLCNLSLKPLIARPRPFTLSEIELLVAMPKDWSFPSGHSSAAFAAAAALAVQGGAWRWWPYILATLIAFSRLYLYVHFPGDVICGVLLGLLCGYLARYAVKSMVAKRQ